MGRVTVWVPDELEATIREALPGVNWSAATQAGLRALLGCGHPRLCCTDCGTETTAETIARAAVTAMHLELMRELRVLVDRFSTAEGAARVVHRVAQAHGVLDPGPVPRATRYARQIRDDAAPVVNLPTQAAAVHRHPSNPTKETA